MKESKSSKAKQTVSTQSTQKKKKVPPVIAKPVIDPAVASTVSEGLAHHGEDEPLKIEPSSEPVLDQ